MPPGPVVVVEDVVVVPEVVVVDELEELEELEDDEPELEAYVKAFDSDAV